MLRTALLRLFLLCPFIGLCGLSAAIARPRQEASLCYAEDTINRHRCFDNANRLTTKVAPSEPTVTYAYDILDRLVGASDNSAAVTAPTTSGTLSTSSFAYDALNRLRITYGLQ